MTRHIVCPAHRPSVFCSESSTHARHLSKPGSLWRPVLPAQLCCCLAWHQSVQPLLNVKSARLTCRPRPAPVRGSHCHHQLLSLVLRGFPDLAQVLPLLRLLKVLIKALQDKIPQHIGFIGSVSNGCMGVSTNCFGENYNDNLCQYPKI